MTETTPGKSKVLAGLLGIIPPTGALGLHRFYLGYTGLGIAHICLLGFGILLTITVIGAIIGGPLLIGNVIWGIIEGIMILAGSISKDASGRSLEK
jgi:TM2 domain-containing membrane protein YozV